MSGEGFFRVLLIFLMNLLLMRLSQEQAGRSKWDTFDCSTDNLGKWLLVEMLFVCLMPFRELHFTL